MFIDSSVQICRLMGAGHYLPIHSWSAHIAHPSHSATTHERDSAAAHYCCTSQLTTGAAVVCCCSTARVGLYQSQSLSATRIDR